MKLNFNSHAHVERDIFARCNELLDVYFNSHAHVERDSLALHQYLFLYNFNSHAHVERDSELKKMIKDLIISTHTLTWSVTLFH